MFALNKKSEGHCVFSAKNIIFAKQNLADTRVMKLNRRVEMH